MLGDIIAGVFFLLAMLCVHAATRNPNTDAETRASSTIALLGAMIFGGLAALTLFVKFVVWLS